MKDLSPTPPRGDDPLVVERDRSEERTTGYRVRKLVRDVAGEAVQVSWLSAALLPFLVVATLTLDLPFTRFDDWATSPAMAPSQWFSRGDLLFSFSLFAMILMTRRRGAVTVRRAQTIAWVGLGVLASLMVLYLAPRLTSTDFPRAAYFLGIGLGWFLGPRVAIHLYDITRGGRWWRPPFFAAIGGFITQAALYFPIAYWGTTAPWMFWMAADIGIKVILTIGFLVMYWLLRKRITPRSGLGGR